jgi:membrane fusion protein, multidrug efflux system
VTPLLQRRLVIVLVAAGLLFALVIGYHAAGAYMMKKYMATNSAPPATVTITRAALDAWQPEIVAVGSLRALRGVDVTTEVGGMVRSVNFKAGSEVRAGATLVELISDSDRAQLQALEAAAELAQVTLDRDQVQYDVKAISKAQLDADAADLRNRRALAQAQAALLAKKTLVAPFAGRVGITTVNPGQYLNPGDKVVTLQAIDNLYVDFHVPQQEYPRLASGQVVSVTADAYPGRSFPGTLAATDSKVDPGTRNIAVEAVIENHQRELQPGMFVRISVSSGQPQNYVTIPQTAVAYNPYGATVFVAKTDDKGQKVAQQVVVTPGPTRGDQVAILKGIAAGDEVVTSGGLKLQNGTPLVVDNSLQPANEAKPTPQEQ